MEILKSLEPLAKPQIDRRTFVKTVAVIAATLAGAGCLTEKQPKQKQNQTQEIPTKEPDKEKEIREIKSKLRGRLGQLTTKVTEVDKDNKFFAIDNMSLPSGMYIIKKENGEHEAGISTENKTIIPRYEVSISKKIDPGFLGWEVARLAANPPLSEVGRQDLINHYDELLNKAKADNNEKVLSLLSRLFSSSTQLNFPEGTPVNVTEEEINAVDISSTGIPYSELSPEGLHDEEEINAVDISSTGIPYSELSPEGLHELKKRMAKSKKFFEDPSLKKGLLAYEEFKRLKDTKKGGLNEVENNYTNAIKDSFAGIYSAMVSGLYLPPDEKMPFNLPLENFYGGKLKVKDFNPLNDAPETKAYLKDFYDKTLQLPIPSTLK